jgi:class 3 adenylate cyclase
MVPSSIATRLKTGSRRIADKHDEVTVLFADIVGFTSLAERLDAADLVATLDELFSKFDEHADRLGLEKIKTVGDEYMVVGGAPRPRADHAEAVADLGAALLETAASRECPDGTTLALRIGMHSGPAVGGVIGKRKLVYDLWGDTVNTANRMQSHGVTGRIHVSAATAAHLHDTHELEQRGPVVIKGKRRDVHLPAAGTPPRSRVISRC